MRFYTILPVLLALLCNALFIPQTVSSQTVIEDEAVYCTGIKLDELLIRFGPPKTVYVSRGNEEWQDDVVFVYDDREFYISADRVWQVALRSALGIKVGDPRAVADLVLAGSAENRGAYLLQPLSGTGWPLMFRVNFDAGLVSAMYVYRSDF